MRGTGSHDVSVDGASVDTERSCSFADPPWPTGPLWRVPILNVLAPPLASVLLGIARGSIAAIAALATQGAESPRGPLAHDDLAMADLAHAHATLDGARAALYESMEELWTLASDDTGIPLRSRARSLLTVQHAADASDEVTSITHRLAGSAAAYRTHRIATAAADVRTARQHILFSHHLGPTIGRAHAGMDVAAPPFL